MPRLSSRLSRRLGRPLTTRETLRLHGQRDDLLELRAKHLAIGRHLVAKALPNGRRYLTEVDALQELMAATVEAGERIDTLSRIFKALSEQEGK